MKTIQEYNKLFWDLVVKYDTTNSNILRKIIHSFDVAHTCFKIACHLKLNAEDRIFAYLIGLFHDVGRFEQWKLYQTYDDFKSIDHGDLSFDILNKLNCCEVFDLSVKQSEVLKMSIKYHTKPYCGNDDEILFYNEIIKNADAFSNVITTANGAQQIVVSSDGYTKELLEDFKQMKLLINYPTNTKVDRCLKLTACSYYVKFPFLREEILKGNYIDIMYETFSQYLNQEDKKTYKDAVEIMKINYICK